MMRTAVCAISAFLIGSIASMGENWPQHRGPNWNGVTSEHSGWDGRAWRIGKVWQTHVGDGCTSPLLVDGKVYVMGWRFTKRTRDRNNPEGIDTVYALDAATGKALWTHNYPQTRLVRYHDFDESNYGGPSATPTFDGDSGRLYTHGINGDFRCLDAANGGEVLWQMNVYDRYKLRKNPMIFPRTNDSDHGCNSSPLLYKGWVIIEVGSLEHGTIIAYDKKTGREAWASELKTWAGETPGPQLITVEGRQCLVTLTLEHLVVMRLDPGHEGETMSKFPWKAGWNQNLALPAVDGNRVLLTGYHWINGGRNDGASAVFDVSLKGIRQLWKKLPCSKANGGTLCRGYAYIGSDNLHCIDMLTGKRRWMDPDITGDDFGCGATVIMTGDDKLLYLSEKNTLYLSEPGHRASTYTRLAKVPNVLAPNKGHTWPHVVLAESKILVKDKSGNLACYGIGAADSPRTDGGQRVAQAAAQPLTSPPKTPPAKPLPVPSATVSASGPPLRHWTLDGRDDGLANRGAFPAKGRLAKALRFDGLDDYADVGTFDVPGNTLTLCAWVKAGKAARGDPRVISKATGWGEQDHYWMLGFTGSTEKPQLRFRLKTRGRTTTLETHAAPVELNRWTHLAAVYDGHEMKLYRDGVVQAATDKSGAIDRSPSVPVWIGGNPPRATDRPYRGAIDDVRVYARPLTEGELRQLAKDEELSAPLAWPRFRGPGGHGIAADGSPPLTWDEAKGLNIAWKAAVPLTGAGSPIICEDLVVLTGGSEKDREAYAFAADNGKLLWRTPIRASGASKQEDEFEGMTYAGSTPVTDGTHIFVIFGNGVCASLSRDGKIVWVRDLGLPGTGYSYCTSLELHGDLLFVDLPAGLEDDPAGRLLALSRLDGRTIWEKSGKDHPAADSWASPIVVPTTKGDLLVTRGGGWVIAREAQSGRRLWQVPSETGDVSTSPIIADGLVVSAGYGDKTDAIGLDGNLAWSSEACAPDVATPLAINGVLLLLDSEGEMTGLRLRDGLKLFATDLCDVHDSMYYASPVAGNGRIYIVADDGVTLAFDAPVPEKREPPVVSVAGRFVDQELCWATPAIADGRMFIRTKTHLYCVASKKATTTGAGAKVKSEPTTSSHREAVRADWHSQYRELDTQLALREKPVPLAIGKPKPLTPGDVLDAQSLLHADDRAPLDVMVRRVRALLAALAAHPAGVRTDDLLARLDQAGRRGDDPERRAAHVCAIRREAMFRHPQLDFDSILFISRGLAFGTTKDGDHMITAYNGFNGLRGGGLYVIQDFRSRAPPIRNLVAESKVAAGRFRGRALPLGAYLSPEFSYDGKTVLFAFTENDDEGKGVYRGRGAWLDSTSYQIFRVGIDGSGLTQLTAGAFDHFDPCWLPNGRIVFCSDRRGGVHRCASKGNDVYPGRQFNLHSMLPDGSDLFPISWHETNDWRR